MLICFGWGDSNRLNPVESLYKRKKPARKPEELSDTAVEEALHPSPLNV
jgi:hypothetical protein